MFETGWAPVEVGLAGKALAQVIMENLIVSDTQRPHFNPAVVDFTIL